MPQYSELKDYWAEYPPPHISLMLVGAALGVDWDKVRSGMSATKELAAMPPPSESGPSIAELAAKITPPRGDTLAASVQALRGLKSPPASALH